MKLLLILMMPLCLAQLTEIMFDPLGSDNNQEYIELFTEYNLENWTVSDSESNDTLVHLAGNKTGIVLIVEEGFNCQGSCYSAGTTIGNNLNNAGDTISLYFPNGTLFDEMSYNQAITPGMSLQFCDDWVEAEPTLGRTNACAVEHVIHSLNQTADNLTNQSNQSVNQPSINQSNQLVNLTDSINHSMDNYSLQTNLNTSEIDNTTIFECPSIAITSDKFVYDEGDKVKYSINTAPVEYWVEDLSGKIVKNSYVSASTAQKSWTPKCSNGNVFVIKAMQVNCTEIAEAYIVVKCSVISNEINNDLQIKEICTSKDECAEFGETIKVDLKISKGSSSKQVVEVYAQGDKGTISDRTKLYVTDKNVEFDVSLPLKIFDNCDWKYSNGTYDLVVSGLDHKTTKQFEISGRKKGICKEKVIVEESECPVCEVFEKQEIKSFYTLAKKYSDEIKLYANVDCQNCSLVVSNSIGPIKSVVVNESGKYSMTVPAHDGYRLDLCIMNSTLAVPFEVPKEEVKPKFVPKPLPKIEPRRGFRAWLMKKFGFL